jgi:hypothetical protein
MNPVDDKSVIENLRTLLREAVRLRNELHERERRINSDLNAAVGAIEKPKAMAASA